MSGFDAKANRLLQDELDRYARGEVSFKGLQGGFLASNNRKPKKQRYSSRVAADPLAAMEQLLQEDMAVFDTGCLPEGSSAAGSSSHSFCPCPGQHGSTIPTQQRQQQQQQDSARLPEFEEDDRVQELVQAELRQLQRGANKIQEPAWGPDAGAFAAFGARCVERQAVPEQGKCQVPGCSRDAVVLCSDCKLGGVLFCPQHDSEQHPFAHEHRRAALTSGFKQPLRPTQQYEDGQAQGQHRHQLGAHEQQQAGEQHASWPDVVKVFDLPPGRPCSCANDSSAKHWVLQEQRKPLIVVGQSGRFDFFRAFYSCSSCGAGQWQSWEDFLQLGLYPASLDPANQTYVSEAQLQRMRETARLTVCSNRATARIIDGIGAAEYGQVNKVNAETLNNAFILWRRVQHHLELCQGQERATCPACADNLHSAHADGNHKLWVQDGQQVNRDSWYKDQKGAIFVDDKEVKQMVELVQAAGGKDSQSQAKLCGRSSFHAAGDRATPTPGRLLNGRFILGCSHLLILRAANMPAEFGGERYAYPMLMAAEMVQRNARFFFGDLASKWYPYLLSLSEKIELLLEEEPGAIPAGTPRHLLLTPEAVSRLRPVTSAVHSRAHVWYCQGKYGPEFQTGVGLENGEFTELINAFLSERGSAVRSMSIGRSTDFLTELALDWNWDKIIALASYMLSRFKSAASKLVEANAEWKKQRLEVQQCYRVQLTDAAVAGIGKDVLAAAEGQWQRSSRRLTPSGQYVKLILSIQEAGALADLLSCFDAADVVLASATLADVQALVTKLKEQLPKLEADVKRMHKELLPMAARAMPGDAAQGGAAAAAAGMQQQAVPQDSGEGVTSLAAAVLEELQGLLPRLSGLSDGEANLRDRLLLLAKDVATAHSKLRCLAAVANTPAGEAAWKQELAEFTLCDYEDDMEAHHLLLCQWNAKFSAGGLASKEANAVRERVTGLKRTLRSTITKYNTLRSHGSVDRPADVTEEQVVSGEFPWIFRGLDDGSPGNLPFKVKLSLWKAHNRVLRAKEQEVKVRRDAEAFQQYYVRLSQQLSASSPPHTAWLLQHAEDAGLQSGLAALVRRGMLFVGSQLQAAQEVLRQIPDNTVQGM